MITNAGPEFYVDPSTLKCYYREWKDDVLHLYERGTPKFEEIAAWEEYAYYLRYRKFVQNYETQNDLGSIDPEVIAFAREIVQKRATEFGFSDVGDTLVWYLRGGLTDAEALEELAMLNRDYETLGSGAASSERMIVPNVLYDGNGGDVYDPVDLRASGSSSPSEG